MHTHHGKRYFDNKSVFILANDQQQPRSQQSTTTSSTTSSSSSSSSNFSEDTIKHITKSGFTREQAIEELKVTNGDPTKALVSLMAKSLSVPKRKR